MERTSEAEILRREKWIWWYVGKNARRPVRLFPAIPP